MGANIGRRRFFEWMAIGAVGCAGCRPISEDTTSSSDDEDSAPRRSVALTIGVVDDEQLAAAIREQWELRGDGQLDVNTLAASELLSSSKPPEVDGLLLPSRMLGSIAERGWLLPLSEGVLRDPNLAWSDIFDVVRRSESLWGRTTYALPLGSPPFFLIYRGDLWERLGLAEPETWDDLNTAIEQARTAVDGAEDVPPLLVAEPLAIGWAGLSLLARAAPYALHRGSLALWFDLETMDALIAGAPFQRALEQLVATSSAESLDLNPQQAFERVVAGDALLSISWPTRHPSLNKKLPVPADRMRVAELPGSREAYRRERDEWTTRTDDEQSRVTLLGAGGRVAVVLKRSRHRSATANLLVWFCGQQWGGQVGSSSSATTMVRQQQLAEPAEWLPDHWGERINQQYVETLRSAMQRSSVVVAPRIPGQEEYLAALDEAVRSAVRGERATSEALQQAAESWNAITDRLGREAQRAAYQHSLGLG